MSEEEIFSKLKKIIIDQFGVEEDKITMESVFSDDLAADSLDIVELVMNIEDEFNIQIPDDQAEKLITIGDVVEYIKNNM